MSTSQKTAIVIGGSIAGLLAARVLSDHFERVTVIERDALPQAGDYRAGVPQAHHLHTLLVRGQQILEKLFPGFTDDLTAAGAPTAVWGLENAFLTTGGWTRQFDSGIVSNVCGRAQLEWLVRRRVASIQNITFLTEREVQHLLASADGQTVIGVAIESRIDHTTENLHADLVVDASGRGSKAPDWLQQMGYSAPEETLINALCGYATRWYEGGTLAGMKAVAIQARPAQGLYRGGGIIQVEGGRWVLTLLGANGDYPPTDEAGFLDYARSLPTTAFYDFIQQAKPISPIYGYRKLENRMRHYERVKRRPEQFIVIGDAACALNPIYGQGMSAAAIEAMELDTLLKHYRGDNLTGLAARFQKRLYQLVQGPWLLATSEDLRYPLVEGGQADLTTRISHWYFDLLARAMPRDNQITLAFFQGMNLLRSPQSLMFPAIFWRVMWHSWFSKPSKTAPSADYTPITSA